MIVYGYDIETTGLNPFSSDLVTIQYSHEDEDLSLYRRWDYGSERDMLLDFLNDWSRIKRSRAHGGALFVAFNVLKFDAPFLLTKAQEHDIASAPRWNDEYVWQNIVHGPAFLDLAQLLGDDMMKFAEWRNCLTGTYGDFESKQIPVFFENGDYEMIEQYVRDEMQTLENVYKEVQKESFFQELQNLRERASAEWQTRDSASLNDF